MVFITLCCKSALRTALLVLALVATPVLGGEGLAVRNASLVANEDWYHLNADLDIALSKPLEEALSKGISLNFMVEFELTRPRWYWWDESIASVRQNLRLSYHALTRQYQLSSNAGNKSFATLSEAREAMSHLVEWKILERGQLVKGVSYNAALRVKLDVNQLPRPLQVQALGSTEWNLSSDWYRFSVVPQ